MERQIGMEPLIGNCLPNLHEQHLNLHPRPPQAHNKRLPRQSPQPLKYHRPQQIPTVRQPRQARPHANGTLEDVVRGRGESRSGEEGGGGEDGVEVGAEGGEAGGEIDEEVG